MDREQVTIEVRKLNDERGMGLTVYVAAKGWEEAT